MKLKIFVVLVFIVGFFRCSASEEGNNTEEIIPVNFGKDVSYYNDTKSLDVFGDGVDGETSFNLRYKLFFLYPPDEPINIPINSVEVINVMAIDFKTEKPAADLAINFFISEINGVPSSEYDNLDDYGKLATVISYTDENGIAKVSFKSGKIPDVNYKIQASANFAESVFQEIYVTDTPKGDLEIVPKNETGIPLHTVKIMLLPGSFNCDYFFPTKPPQDEVIGSKTVATPDSSVIFKHLPVNNYFTVVATARSGPNGGTLTAAGCIDGLMVQPDIVNKRTLKLYLLTLNPAGCYSFVSEFDFTNAIPGQAGEIINMIVELFYDPGNFILDMVITLIKQYFGEFWGNIADTVMGPFKKQLGDLITDWFFENSPDWIQCFFQVGQDLTQIVAKAEIVGILKLSKLTSDYFIQGEEDWTGINLYWTLGCSEKGPCKGVNFNAIKNLCEYDAEKDKCKCPITLNQLQNTSVPMDLVSGIFTATVANFDTLKIDKHKIQLNYGKLILFVINELLLPAVTGGEYNSIEDVLKSIIDCHAIAQGFVGDILDQIGISKGDLENFCNGAVNFLVSPVEELISALSLDSNLRVYGSCKFKDNDDDLIVDELINGLWFGHVVIDGQEGEEFEGKFTGKRTNTCY